VLVLKHHGRTPNLVAVTIAPPVRGLVTSWHDAKAGCAFFAADGSDKTKAATTEKLRSHSPLSSANFH
jgi:hypothetical protein